MMIDKELFVNKQLFPIRISDYLPDCDEGYVVYSPLSHALIIVDELDLKELEQQLLHNGRFDNNSLQQQLIDDAKIPTPNYVTSPDDVFALTILPNNICNFSCSYCYAAKGHGNDELSKEVLLTVLDFFVDAKRINRKDLYISFGGGGEPLLSWDKVKIVLDYSHALAEKNGFDIHYSYASNGSVMNDEILAAIHQYNIKVNVSFDILEEIQSKQRKNYRKVCETLDILLDNDVTPTINSVITPLNVSLQSDMVEEVHRRFPKLNRLSFDYVVDGKLFDDSQKLKEFYNNYTYHFYKACTKGHQYGSSVSSIKHHNLSLLKTRACPGGFDLTPTGELSMCFFVSSPKEKLYHDFVYGRVHEGKIEFDRNKFRSLVEYSSNNKEQCRNCFIRWHCGGGCLFHTRSYSDAMLAEMCEFQRRFSLISLINDIKGYNILSQL